MLEHEYYNLHSSAQGAAQEAKNAANSFAFRIMVEHLYFVHKMGVREISHQLCCKQKKVKSIIDSAKQNYDAYNTRKHKGT